MLKQKKPLQAKTNLKSKTNLKPRSDNPTKQVKPSITKLKKHAIKVFNRAVKYRDSELYEDQWIFTCITCPRQVVFSWFDGNKWRFNKQAHAGHFQPCQFEPTRFNEMNVNGQCSTCNYNQGEQYRYASALDRKYGNGTANMLEKEAHRKGYRRSLEELLEIISNAEAEIEFYENQRKST